MNTKDIRRGGKSDSQFFIPGKKTWLHIILTGASYFLILYLKKYQCVFIVWLSLNYEYIKINNVILKLGMYLHGLASCQSLVSLAQPRLLVTLSHFYPNAINKKAFKKQNSWRHEVRFRADTGQRINQPIR